MDLKNKRKYRSRNKIRKNSTRKRLSVFRSNKNIYVQVIDDINGKTITSASSLEKELTKEKMSKITEGMGLPPGMKLPF